MDPFNLITRRSASGDLRVRSLGETEEEKPTENLRNRYRTSTKENVKLL
jgi:hypothetical protein